MTTRVEQVDDGCCGESYCAAPTTENAARQCPRCGTRGRSVERLTVAALTTGSVPADPPYRLCRRLDCEVVYFGENGTTITAAGLHVAPGMKSKAPGALLCYCFQYDRGDIEAELATAGATTIPQRIAAEVKAGNCACEVRNPSGRCCLGDVQEAVEEIRARLDTCEKVTR